MKRDGKRGSQIVHWHRTIVLAPHQQSDGQLAVSSGQVEAYQSANPHSFPFCPMSFSPFILSPSSPSPTEVTAHTNAWSPPPLRVYATAARWHSQRCLCLCLCLSVWLLLPRQPATGPPALRVFAPACWHWLRHGGACQPFYARTHPRTRSTCMCRSPAED